MDIARQEGMRTLPMAGLAKARAGLTSLDESFASRAAMPKCIIFVTKSLQGETFPIPATLENLLTGETPVAHSLLKNKTPSTK